MKKETIKKDSEYYIGVGLCFGVAFGAAFDNIGLGVCLGLVFGVAMQKEILILRNLLQKSNLVIFIIHFATEMLQPISYN